MTATTDPAEREAPLVVHVLGELRAVRGDAEVRPRGMLASLLAVLALAAGRPVPVAELAERLWGPEPPDNASARLHVHVSRLRGRLADLGTARTIELRSHCYALDVDAAASDLVVLESHLIKARSAARAGDLVTAASHGASALARWDEPLVLLATDSDWARAEVTRIREAVFDGLESYAETMISLGRSDEVTARLAAHVQAHPLREQGVRLWMLALYEAGRQSEALEAYARARTRLVDELGVNPSPALEATYLALLRQDPASAGLTTAPETVGAAGKAPPTVCRLPRAASPLLGRHRLLTLAEEALFASGSGDHIVVLVGMGGAGKTRVAAEIARRAAPSMPLVWWVPASDSLAVSEALVQLADELGIAAAGEQAHRLEALWSALRGRDDWLLVLDDCPDPDLLGAAVPLPTSGHLLVTSRCQAWGRLGRTIPVELLDARTSTSLLLASAPSADSEPTAQLVAELGGLALALVQAAAYIDQTGMGVGRYLDLYRRRRLELLARALPDDYDASVATTWNISFDRMRESPGAAELLRLCSSLGDASVPGSWLVGSDGDSESPFQDELDLEDAIAVLLRFSLVTREADGIRVHPLVCAALRCHLSAHERIAADANAARLLRAKAPLHPDDPRAWGEAAAWALHALTVAAHLVRSDQQAAGWLFEVAGRSLSARAFLGPARQALEQALDCARASPGSLRDQARLTSELGVVHERLGELAESRRLQEEALALCGPSRPMNLLTEASIRRRLGNVLFCQRDLPASREALTRAVADLEGLDEPHELGSTLVDLGMSLEASGHFDEAERALTRALDLLVLDGGTDHPDSIHARSVLAVVRQDLGDISGAARAQQDVLEAMIAQVGAGHPDTGHAFDRLGYVMNLAGRAEEARAAHAQAIAVLTACYGADHVELGMPWTNLGLVHLRLGELGAALSAQERSEHLFISHLGPTHPHVGMAAARRAEVLIRTGHTEEGAAALGLAVDVLRKALGRDHPDTRAASERLRALSERDRC